MRKGIWAIFVVLMVLMLIGGQATRTVYAEASNEHRPNVYDALDKLTANEVAELQASITNVSKEYNLDVAVVITDQTQGKSSRDFADDFYDNQGYGVGPDHSGLLLLINMDQREVWISTAGKAIDIFTDDRISNMVNDVTAPLSNGNFDEACKTFVDDVGSIAKMGVPAGQNRVGSETDEAVSEDQDETDTQPVAGSSYFGRMFGMMKSVWVYVIALIVALIATFLVSRSSKGKVTINNLTYEENDSFVLSDDHEEFIRESTTRTKITKESSSSTHTSSSGKTHGGGGGKF